MKYSKAIQFLYGLQLFGARLGLENTHKLARLIGNPQERLRFIHVAGTNGKGSTCAMLESIYRAAGLRVGLFTSPHLVSFRERIQINRQLISETEVVAPVEQLRQVLREFDKTDHPTFFEVVTVIALGYFAAQRCDLVIWETGLGGRLDATNIVTPLASVITNVQLDHEKWLGETIEEIAAEKAGIIKPGVPILTCAEEPGLSVIAQMARQCGSPLHVVEEPLQEIEVSLKGEHQRLNAALAVATARTLDPRLPISETAIREGLASVSWPGRLQTIKRAHQTILVDGAHNPAGVRTLRAAVEKGFGDARWTLILGVMRDKNVALICEILAPLAPKIVACRVNSERSAAPDQLAQFCRAAYPKAEIKTASSIEVALKMCAEDEFVIVTGSLYFAGEALQVLDPASGPDERTLNEWTLEQR